MKIVSKSAAFLLLIGWNLVPANAQEKFQSSGAIVFYVDVSCFKMLANPDSTFWQLQGYVDRTQFRFMPKDSGFVTGYSGRMTLKDRSGQIVFERSWASPVDAVVSEADTGRESPWFFELNGLAPPGSYAASVQLWDAVDTSRVGTCEASVDIRDFRAPDDVQLSDVQLSSQIQKGGQEGSLFVKNGYTVIPNPSRLFGSNLPRLFVYAEVYNLDFKEGQGGQYKTEFIVTDEAGSVIREFPSKSYAKVGRTALILHSVNVLSLVTGRYNLVVRVTDEDSKALTQAKETFVVYREGESIAEMTSEGESFFSDIDEKGIERAGHIVSLVGSDDEKKMFKEIGDLAGQKKFLDKFWKDRDPSPGTKGNEALMDYYTRYEKANQLFSSPNRPGWKTDMGRIYVVYGPPAQIEKHDFEINLPPYQIWYYLQLKNQPTQTIFVFADKSGTGTPALIHSNARGEYSNTAWMEELRRF